MEINILQVNNIIKILDCKEIFQPYKINMENLGN